LGKYLGKKWHIPNIKVAQQNIYNAEIYAFKNPNQSRRHDLDENQNRIIELVVDQ